MSQKVNCYILYMKNTNPFPLRMANELRSYLEESATKNARSLNNEIVHRLEISCIEDQNPVAADLLQSDDLESVLTPSLPASLARKIAKQNVNSGIALASIFVDEFNDLINGAVLLGKCEVELDIATLTRSMPVTDAEIGIALKLINTVFEQAGYIVKTNGDKIIISF